MFRKLHAIAPDDGVTVFVEGIAIRVDRGESAAAAALLAGAHGTRRSVVSGQARAPYCMMGVCFECLMVIDGVAGQQACLVPVREGMRIAWQTHLPALPAAARPSV